VLRSTTSILLAFTLAGCTTLGSTYDPPQVNSTARYSAGTAGNKTITAEVKWWRAFNDATLDRLVEAGLAQNLTVAQAVERVVAARATAVSTGLNNLPTGSTLADITASGSSPSDRVDFAQTGTASASWELDLFGGLAKQREAAGATLDAAIEEANAARLSLIGDIASNYIQARGYQDRLQIARSTLEAQNKTLNVPLSRTRPASPVRSISNSYRAMSAPPPPPYRALKSCSAPASTASASCSDRSRRPSRVRSVTARKSRGSMLPQPPACLPI